LPDDGRKKVVIVEALPKNPSGKVLKRELRETHAGRGPNQP
jgi:fatty-acyl-CoA synthase